MQPAQHISLSLGIQIHQCVSAHQQINSGYRGIFDQVVATENDCAAQIFAKYVSAVRRLEVALQ
jgi:hypothetical protein